MSNEVDNWVVRLFEYKCLWDVFGNRLITVKSAVIAMLRGLPFCFKTIIKGFRNE